MKYTLTRNGDSWFLWREREVDTDILGVEATEAEAKICEFALNAIANGHGLLEVIGGHIHDWEAYSGPTEGIAP